MLTFKRALHTTGNIWMRILNLACTPAALFSALLISVVTLLAMDVIDWYRGADETCATTTLVIRIGRDGTAHVD